MELIIVKKIKIFGIVAMFFILVACNESGGNPGNGDIDGSTLAQETPNQDATSTGADSESSNEIVASVDSPYHLVWYGLGVALIDFSTGEMMGTFEAEAGAMIWNFFDFDNGYFGLLVEYGIGDGNISIATNADGNITMTDSFGNEINQDEVGLRFLILDEDLAIVDELEITNEDLQDHMVQFGMHAVYEAGQLVIYYVTYWMRTLWGYEEFQSIRRYHVYSGITEDLLEITDETLLLQEVRHITFERIAFRGSILHNEPRGLLYGFVDLTTGEMTVFEESDFPIHSNDRIQVVNSTILIREELAPPTMGVLGASISVLRGEVIVFNVVTGENHLIRLEGLESNWAILSLDGRYIVTVDGALSYLRKYDATSGSLVAEQAIHIQGERILDIIPLSDGRYGVRSATVEGIIHFELVTLP